MGVVVVICVVNFGNCIQKRKGYFYYFFILKE